MRNIEALWHLTLWVAAVTLLVLVVLTIVKDHSVGPYYLDSAALRGYCISGRADWSDDPVVYCTDDIDKALRVLRELNGGGK